MDNENKQAIADALTEALKLTRCYECLDDIRITKIQGISEGHNGTTFSWTEEYADVYIITSDVPYRHICITADSGIAMIEDIIKGLRGSK